MFTCDITNRCRGVKIWRRTKHKKGTIAKQGSTLDTALHTQHYAHVLQQQLTQLKLQGSCRQHRILLGRTVVTARVSGSEGVGV